MIKAELSYNPYLMEINVTFNGQPPHINSLIEKYQHIVLQDWITELPQIFHDEMNGYYFELDFSGTELDCDEITAAFRAAGVSEEEVTVFLKNELECREVKIERIRDLLEWLGKNRCEIFDYDSFRIEYTELFDSDYTCVIIHGEPQKSKLKDVSAENVSDIAELKCTDLTHTPILYGVSAESLDLIQNDLRTLRERKDVRDDQLFFMIDGALERKKTVRLIEDLGISAPNVVSGINDAAVRKYFLIYPFSDYITAAIKAFGTAIDKLDDHQRQESKRHALKGDAVHDRIDFLDDSIKRIKDTDNEIVSHGTVQMPAEFTALADDLKAKISGWESRKTKITDSEAAHTAALNFNAMMNRAFFEFCAELDNAAIINAQMIREEYIRLYKKARLDENFADRIPFSADTPAEQLQDQVSSLLALKEEQYVTQKNSLIGQLFRSAEANADQPPTLVTTYYYQAWREHMINVITPVIKKIMMDKHILLINYSNRLTDVYHNKLTELLKRQTEARDSAAANLSESEKLLQKDNKWLERFRERLESIERS